MNTSDSTFSRDVQAMPANANEWVVYCRIGGGIYFRGAIEDCRKAEAEGTALGYWLGCVPAWRF